MDHSIAVLSLVGVEKILIGLLVTTLDDPRNAVQVNRTQIYHCVGVAHLSRLKVATYSQLPILLYSISTEITIAYFILSGSMIAL